MNPSLGPLCVVVVVICVAILGKHFVILILYISHETNCEIEELLNELYSSFSTAVAAKKLFFLAKNVVGC